MTNSLKVVLKPLVRSVMAAGAAMVLISGAAGCGRKSAPSAAAGGERVYRIAFASFGPDAAADKAIEGY
ncbi:MAG: hypothetical protein WCN95_16335, partial [bacterium]